MTKQITTSLVLLGVLLTSPLLADDTLDSVLSAENKQKGVTDKSVGKIGDMVFLRRATVDLIGRIPNVAEIDEYLAWPEAERRDLLVDKLLTSNRFADPVSYTHLTLPTKA